jgi:L-ascorbate metabolism protein UlaG (beta-lactamase superfamily)
MFALGDTIIHVDPVSREADYSTMPKADLVLVTHEHGDHLDPAAIAAVRQDDTIIILPEKCAPAVSGSAVMKNGDVRTAVGLKIEAVPAYNIVHKRPSGEPFHPRGVGNGYVIAFGDTRVYVAGDTENVPEMKKLKDIDVAFLPMNLPYTMTPEMVADAARAFRPKILYPYHFGNTDTSELVRLLAAEKSIEVRIRSMK